VRLTNPRRALEAASKFELPTYIGRGGQTSGFACDAVDDQQVIMNAYRDQPTHDELNLTNQINMGI